MAARSISLLLLLCFCVFLSASLPLEPVSARHVDSTPRQQLLLPLPVPVSLNQQHEAQLGIPENKTGPGEEMICDREFIQLFHLSMGSEKTLARRPSFRCLWLWLLPSSIVCIALYSLLFLPSSPLSSSSSSSSPIKNGASSSALSFPMFPHQQRSRLLQVPQIAWGLNNQKIAIARALLTARFLNRTLILPSLSSSLTYKDTSHIQPLPFDRIFSLARFNYRCRGFVSIAKPSEKFLQETTVFNISKGSGRRWTKDRDLEQLLELRKTDMDRHSVIRLSGKNPFLWHDHWPVHDYARVFRCLVLVQNISSEVDRILSNLKQRSLQLSTAKQDGGKDVEGGISRYDVEDLGKRSRGFQTSSGYVAVHMRIEKDWMIHCKKTEERIKTHQGKTLNICSSKQEIMENVRYIPGLKKPSILYLAVADALLEDSSLLEGWGDGLIPFEKKRLGFMEIYKRYPYLIQSALDYEVCVRADIFVGNSFSTFSSLVVMERTLRMLRRQPSNPCKGRFPSYAYNIHSIDGKGPHLWTTNLSDVSLQAISYGTNHVSCDKSSLLVSSSWD